MSHVGGNPSDTYSGYSTMVYEYTDGWPDDVLNEEQQAVKANELIISPEDKEHSIIPRQIIPTPEETPAEILPPLSSSGGAEKRKLHSDTDLDALHLHQTEAKLWWYRENYNKLQQENARLRTHQVADLQFKLSKCPGEPTAPPTGASESNSKSTVLQKAAEVLGSAAGGGKTNFTFNFKKSFEIKEGNFGVGVMDRCNRAIYVAHSMTNALSSGGTHGLRQINCLDMSAFQTIPLHTEPIQDLALNRAQRGILLSVGLDKKAILTNFNCNLQVQTVKTEYPLYSCAWDDVNQNTYYVGTSIGRVLAYDIRYSSRPFLTIYIPTVDTSPVARLKFISSNFQSGAFNRTGMMIQKLNSLWFHSMQQTDRGLLHACDQVSSGGPFLNFDYDPCTRMSLISTKCFEKSKQAKNNHTTCFITDFHSEGFNRIETSRHDINSFSTHEDQSFISRPAIFSIEDGTTVVMANLRANEVVIQDARKDQQQIINVPEGIFEFVAKRINLQPLVAMISNGQVRLYDIKRSS